MTVTLKVTVSFSPVVYNRRVTITTIFFDLDDTLYPADSGLWDEIKERINRYMRERMGIPAEQVSPLRQKLFEQYGTTMRGLELSYALDVPDYLAFVHGLPLKDYIGPVPGLREILQALPQRKFIFTNGDAAHAQRVIRTVGLDGCFNGILDILGMTPYCKPMPETFDMALKLAGEPQARRCMMIDDQPRTTRAARARGMYSVLFGVNTPHPDADAVLSDLRQLPELLEKIA